MIGALAFHSIRSRLRPFAMISLSTLARIVVLSVAMVAIGAVRSNAEPESPSSAQEEYRTQVELGVTFAHFQQQVKRAVGDPRGQRLILETEIGLHALGVYR